jgi:hypothetical protein
MYRIIPWRVRSPDLTVTGLFIRVVLERMRTKEPLTQDLNPANPDEIATVNQELSCRDFDSFVNSIRRCAENERDQFPRCYVSKVIIHK